MNRRTRILRRLIRPRRVPASDWSTMTFFYNGRALGFSPALVSFDGGATWKKFPPAGGESEK